MSSHGEALRQLGIPSLKEFQSRVLGAWESGRDVLVLSGTGSGKSLCFQIPPIITSNIIPTKEYCVTLLTNFNLNATFFLLYFFAELPTIVISPLISLMRDQCAGMQAKGVLPPASPTTYVWHVLSHSRPTLRVFIYSHLSIRCFKLFSRLRSD